MKKSLFIIASAALVLSSCAEDSLRNDIKGEEQAITFETFAQKATRAGEEVAENSGITNHHGLYNYQQSFKVWGSKYVNSVETRVFGEDEEGQIVSGDAQNKWSYSPVRFWDKSANSYDFYAAAPANLAWVWDNTNKKISLNSFSVDGETLGVMTSNTASADAVMPNNKDIMISNDVVREAVNNTMNVGEVNLFFNHILSRLNIAVQKDKVLDDFKVKLNSVKLYKMIKTASFNEANASGAALASGSVARWSSSDAIKFDEAIGYMPASSDAEEMLSNASGDAYKFVYQALVIPSTFGYQSIINLDGSNVASADAPYMSINYTLYDDQDNAIPGGNYEYFYNIADIFNGANSTAVDFCEGWMNTLKITIKPDEIQFCAEVYEWAEKNASTNVPNIASGDALQ